MEASNKIIQSYIHTVENSNIAYILVSNKDNITLEASSTKARTKIDDLIKLLNTGSFIMFINNLGYLPVGKTFSETIRYNNDKLELYGEVLQSNLFLIQLNNLEIQRAQGYIHPYYEQNAQAEHLTKYIYELKSNIKEANLYIEVLKKDVEHNQLKSKEIEEEISIIKNNFIDKINFLTNDIQIKVDNFQNKLLDLKLSIEEVKNNTVLKFTSELDFKKTVALLGLLISVLSSAGLLGNIIDNTTSDSNELEDKIERLIELTND